MFDQIWRNSGQKLLRLDFMSGQLLFLISSTVNATNQVVRFYHVTVGGSLSHGESGKAGIMLAYKLLDCEPTNSKNVKLTLLHVQLLTICISMKQPFFCLNVK